MPRCCSPLMSTRPRALARVRVIVWIAALPHRRHICRRSELDIVAAVIQRAWRRGAPGRTRDGAARTIAGAWRRMSAKWRLVLDTLAAQSSCSIVFERSDSAAVAAAISRAIAWARGRHQRLFAQVRVRARMQVVCGSHSRV